MEERRNVRLNFIWIEHATDRAVLFKFSDDPDDVKLGIDCCWVPRTIIQNDDFADSDEVELPEEFVIKKELEQFLVED